MLDARIQTFLTVCRTLNYTRAAEELHITQPAVSQHIAYLEREYGAKLFELRGKRPALTEAGRTLQAAAATMAHDDRLLHARLAELGRSADPAAASPAALTSLTVGMTLTAGAYIAARPLARWLLAHPDARIDVRSGDTATLLDDLRAGDVDCAFVEGSFDRAAFSCATLCRERLVCACAPDHPRAGTRCSIEDLLDERLVVREAGSGTRAVFENALAARNLSLAAFRIVSETSSIEVIKALVEKDVGISFLYRGAVAAEVAADRLALIELDGTPIEHDIAFVRLPGGIFAQTFDRFFEEVRAELEAQG